MAQTTMASLTLVIFLFALEVEGSGFDFMMLKNPGEDDPFCAFVDCFHSKAEKYCPIKCAGDPEICEAVDCSLPNSDTVCPIKCAPEPIDCSLSSWSPWCDCNVSCGWGVQTRHRHVLQEARHGGKECHQVRSQKRQCNEEEYPRRLLNPVVLLTGGWVDSRVDGRSVEVFSLGQSCSKDLEDIPDERIDHTINLFLGDIIMCGGQYDPYSCLYLDDNQRFVHHSQLANPYKDHIGAVVNDNLLLAGGPTGSMQSWDGERWEEKGKFNGIEDLRRSSCSASISEDAMLMAGGSRNWIGKKQTNKMFKYKNGVWERMEDYPGPARKYHGCAFVKTPEGDSFLIAGGYDGAKRLDSSYLYNIGKRQWEEVGKLTAERNLGKIVSIDRRVIMLGGLDGSGNMVVDVEEFDVETKTWNTIEQKIKQGRRQFDAVVVPGALVAC